MVLFHYFFLPGRRYRNLYPLTSSTQYKTSFPSHGTGRAGQNLLPLHCSCISPGLVILLGKEIIALRQLCMLCLAFSRNNPVYIRSARRDYVSTCWRRTRLSALTTSSKRFPSSSPQSVFILNMCGCIFNPG